MPPAGDALPSDGNSHAVLGNVDRTNASLAEVEPLSRDNMNAARAVRRLVVQPIRCRWRMRPQPFSSRRVTCLQRLPIGKRQRHPSLAKKTSVTVIRPCGHIQHKECVDISMPALAEQGRQSHESAYPCWEPH